MRSVIPKSNLTESLSAFSDWRVSSYPSRFASAGGVGFLAGASTSGGSCRPFPERLQTLAEVAHHLRQATGAEHQEDDDEDDDQLAYAHAEHGNPSIGARRISRNVSSSCEVDRIPELRGEIEHGVSAVCYGAGPR